MTVPKGGKPGQEKNHRNFKVFRQELSTKSPETLNRVRRDRPQRERVPIGILPIAEIPLAVVAGEVEFSHGDGAVARALEA